MAVGLGVGADALLRYLAARGRRESLPVLTTVGMALMLALAAWAVPRTAESVKLIGYRAAIALEQSELGPVQPEAWYAGAVGAPPWWLGLETRGRIMAVPESGYAALATSRPGDLVLVGEVRCVAGAGVRTYEVRRAASLIDQPPVVTPCRPELVT